MFITIIFIVVLVLVLVCKMAAKKNSRYALQSTPTPTPFIETDTFKADMVCAWNTVMPTCLFALCGGFLRTNTNR